MHDVIEDLWPELAHNLPPKRAATVGAMTRPTPNFVVLDGSLPDVGRLVSALLGERQAVESRSWSHPQEPTTEECWADVLADPRAQTRKRRGSDQPVSHTFYRLADEPRDTILVACSKCDWKAAFRRDG